MPKQSKKPVKSEAPILKPALYSLVLKDGSLEYKTEGETVSEALEKIQPTNVLKNRLLLTVRKGAQSFTRRFYPFQMRKLLVNKLFKTVFEKQVNLMLK